MKKRNHKRRACNAQEGKSWSTDERIKVQKLEYGEGQTQKRYYDSGESSYNQQMMRRLRSMVKDRSQAGKSSGFKPKKEGPKAKHEP